MHIAVFGLWLQFLINIMEYEVKCMRVEKVQYSGSYLMAKS